MVYQIPPASVIRQPYGWYQRLSAYLAVPKKLIKFGSSILLANALELCRTSLKPHLAVTRVVHSGSEAVVHFAVTQDLKSAPQSLFKSGLLK